MGLPCNLADFYMSPSRPAGRVCAAVNDLARRVTTVWLSRFLNERGRGGRPAAAEDFLREMAAWAQESRQEAPHMAHYETVLQAYVRVQPLPWM